jgi:hypothetical protein
MSAYFATLYILTNILRELKDIERSSYRLHKITAILCCQAERMTKRGGGGLLVVPEKEFVTKTNKN